MAAGFGVQVRAVTRGGEVDARKVSNISILDEECARMPLKGNENNNKVPHARSETGADRPGRQ